MNWRDLALVMLTGTLWWSMWHHERAVANWRRERQRLNASS